MGFYRKLLDLKSLIYDFLTEPRTVRISTIASIITIFATLIIGVLVAQFDPDGYNIVDNYISDLGSFKHTPMPYFLDYGAMITSILMIPMTFYMEKILAPSPLNLKEFPRMRYRLSGLGFFFMIMGTFGFFMIGLFSEDRTGPLGLHSLFSPVVFAGLVISSLFYGLLILFYRTEISKLIGLYMAIVPFITGLLMLKYYTPLYEWIMLFSLLIWMVPVFHIFIKRL